MDSRLLFTIILSICAAIYLGITIQAFRRRTFAEQTAIVLMVYSSLALVWVGVQVAVEYQIFGFLPPPVARRLPFYGAFLLAMVFAHLTKRFLRIQFDDRRWWWLAGFWLFGLMLLDTNAFAMPQYVLEGAGWRISREALTESVTILGWGIFMVHATLQTARVYRQTVAQPLHRNRLSYWSLALMFTVPGAALLFIGQTLLGHGIYVVGTWLAGYGILTHRLPDVRRTARTAWSFSLVTGLTVALYTVGFVMAPELFRTLPEYPTWLIGAGLALVLAVLLNPLLTLVRQLINRLLTGEKYDASRTVGEYSASISNILDLERLTTVAIGLIHEAVGIQRGALFLVDLVKDPQAVEFYQLRGIRGLGDHDPGNGSLAATSPVAEALNQEYGALTQYDIDLLPRFRAVAPVERNWLSALGMDVYVPVYASGQWIGLFALGPKVSGDRYFDEDLQLLSTLADQTAVALQNARLVEDLVRLNSDIKEAYNALDGANHQLAHLDRTKSDFINIVSHELRTPVTVIHGYSQILLNDLSARGNNHHLQLVQGIHSGTTRLMEIIDSMLDMAKVDARTLQLNPNPVYLPPLMRAVLEELEKAIAERSITLEVGDLTALPPIEVDLEAVHKVFYHIIINAIKFTPDGGRIHLTGRHLQEDDTGGLPGGALQIVVADSGIGIDPRYLEMIFTKFYQTGEVALHSTGKTKFKGGGPGLGLAIARGIVEAHSGRIWAESTGYDEENCPGSQFYVTLPLKQPRPQRGTGALNPASLPPEQKHKDAEKLLQGQIAR